MKKDKTYVYEVKLSVIISVDAPPSKKKLREILAENALAWLKTMDEVGELPGAVDSFSLVDQYIDEVK